MTAGGDGTQSAKTKSGGEAMGLGAGVRRFPAMLLTRLTRATISKSSERGRGYVCGREGVVGDASRRESH